MELKRIDKVGCSQTATKYTIKTAQIQTKDNCLEAARAHLQYCCGSSSKINSKSNSNSNVAVWPKDNKNNNKISTQRHLRLLLITMTVSMTFLQLPSSSIAASVERHPRQLQHYIDLSSSTNSSSSSSNSSSSSENRSVSSIPFFDDKMQQSSSSRRTRLRKRHSEYLYLERHLEESATDLEWSNPCNGFFEQSSEESSSSSFVPPASYFMGRLRVVLSREFHNINGTMKAIDISDMKLWCTYNEFYSYLPKIQLNSSIALKSWYRHVQTYIATFAHLGRLQYKYDKATRRSTSDITRELNELLTSARSILCEIETTINGSYPFPKNQEKLKSFTREEMNKQLQFLTYERQSQHHHHFKDTAIEPQMLDLQFAKFRYMHYLQRMWRVIRLRTKRRGQKHRSGELNSSSMRSISGSSSGASSSDTSSGESGSHAGNKSRRNKKQKRQC